VGGIKERGGKNGRQNEGKEGRKISRLVGGRNKREGWEEGKGRQNEGKEGR
jgi:hypothetical protein